LARTFARASRKVGGRYKISVRRMSDGDVYDVYRLTRSGTDIWQPSYVGSGISLERAQTIAQANYRRLQMSISDQF
jgi:hypothetical protein